MLGKKEKGINSDRAKLLTIDPDIVGRWHVDAKSKVRIGNDNWNYSSPDPIPYVISSDGLTLTLPTTTPVAVYTRIFGSGVTLIGVWSMAVIDGGVTYVEEVSYRNDGTYAIHWTADGNYDSDYFGNYQDFGATIYTEERRSIITTNGNNIHFDPPYGSDYSGTFQIVNSDEWNLTVGAVTQNYLRISPV